MDRRAHWNNVYAGKTAEQVTWFQEQPKQSLELIAAAGVPVDAPIIDVGGGMSYLVDNLLNAEFQNVTVLDISSSAIQSSRERLGEAEAQVTWLEADITRIQLPADYYMLWHDRAVFHFLTGKQDQQRYVAAVRRSLQSGGHVILATFAVDGPQQCSGLDIVRYGEQEIKDVFGTGFCFINSIHELHHTPWDTTQKFTYFHLIVE